MKYNIELEEVEFPTADVLGDILPRIDEWDSLELIPGEKVKFPRLKQLEGVEIVRITVLEKIDGKTDSERENEEEELPYDEEDMCCVNMKLEVDVNVTESKVKDWLKEDELYLRSYEIASKSNSTHGNKDVEAIVLFEAYGSDVEVIESPFYEEFWDMRMCEVITEGVCYSKSKVSEKLRDSLRKNIDKLAKETEIDYHPNSNDVVRDLVHPALYSYIEGVSESKKAVIDTSKLKDYDFWGRRYEDSKFQWLPSPFYISQDGKCTIRDYINNLEKDEFPEMYGQLEKLFEVFLPYFEEVWAYSKTMEFWKGVDYTDKRSTKFIFEKPAISFKDEELQVISKIVDYTLQPGESYEGVWHAEGMSHENIVMTGIYFVDRDMDLAGGDIRFKRAFHVDERAQVFWQIVQCRPYVVEQFAWEGYMPLGHFPTEEGYILVFPNCHIHKIAKFINESTTKAASRRIVVFFVVNPEKKIISTREVAPQQGKICLNDAKEYRLELMAERKYDKEKLNVRDLELCEH